MKLTSGILVKRNVFPLQYIEEKLLGTDQSDYAGLVCQQFIKDTIGKTPNKIELVLNTQPMKGSHEIRLAFNGVETFRPLIVNGVRTDSFERLKNKLHRHLTITPKRFYVKVLTVRETVVS